MTALPAEYFPAVGMTVEAAGAQRVALVTGAQATLPSFFAATASDADDDDDDDDDSGILLLYIDIHIYLHT